MNPYQLWILITTVLIFAAYLNICTSYDEFETPRIWPNISDNNSFLQFPGITGAGGLDFNFYDAFEAAVNISKKAPNFIAQFGNYTLLQLWLMIAVGAGAASVATLLGQSYLYKAQDEYEAGLHSDDSQYGPPIKYGAPAPATSYGSPPSSEYGAPAPATFYGSPPSPEYIATLSANSYATLPSPSNEYSSPASSKFGAPPPFESYQVSRRSNSRVRSNA